MNERNKERCLSEIADTLEVNRKIPIVLKKNEEMLDVARLEMYRTHRRNFLYWLATEGKNPDKADGYSPYTVHETNHRTAEFERWVWGNRGGFTLTPTPEDAAAYNDYYKRRDVAEATKGKVQEAISRYYDWMHTELGRPNWEVEPHLKFSSTGATQHDTPVFLDLEERRLIREAAIDYCGPEDWKRISMVWTSLDCGFRPVEVMRANTYWFRPERRKVIIPADETSKERNDKDERVMGDQAAMAVRNWFEQRAEDPMYDDMDAMWLTQKGNPYGSRALGRLVRNLAESKGINTYGRRLTWYAIRHSVGTYIAAERDLKAAKKQLGHKDLKSTLRYDNVTDEEIRDALSRIG